jgi:hypothetical protein
MSTAEQRKIVRDKPETKIAKRRADIPELYRGIYDKAMAGKSKSAGVKSFCLECMGWARNEIKSCTSPQCPLFPYRPYKS